MLRAKTKFGKYLIERKIGEGGFAVVYQAKDTIEGIRVALKIPYGNLITDESLDVFRQEVRLVAKLEHPHIQPLKYADYIEGHFVIVTALGVGSLEDRLTKRMAAKTALSFSRQMLEAVASAHEHKIIHCDLKPDNFLLFPDNQLRLIDFGIARVAHRTLKGSGAGTVGYMAPEQAMGQPSFRSDVFSLGLIMHRMFSSKLPEWPYVWPFPGNDRLKSQLTPDLIQLIQKATQVDAKKRFADAKRMLDAFEQAKRPKANRRSVRADSTSSNWKTVQFRQFKREFGKLLETKQQCGKCAGPVAEAMRSCPWCGKSRKKHPDEEIRFQVACPRCQRGMKSDWKFCAWCYGEGFEPTSNRELGDRRYATRCTNSRCQRKLLMPFMRYCPWCNVKVKRKWKIEGCSDSCRSCGWGVAGEFWSFCPWCTKRLRS